MRTWTMMLVAAATAAVELPAQSPAELARIEVAAAERAISGRNIARNMIRVEPNYAASRAAPGTPGRVARPADRTQAIRDALVIPSAYRRPYGETLLVLSEPQVSGDAAEVTTTLYSTQPSGRQSFVTLLVRLRRTGSGWTVQSAESLGSG